MLKPLDYGHQPVEGVVPSSTSVFELESTPFRDIAALKVRCDEVLQAALVVSDDTPPTLLAAMRYVAEGPGKRLRPLWVYTTGLAFGAPLEALDAAAVAVELMHAYSLVHDDLPAMDDDDWRRGRLTCHKAFDEAIAILVGDALQSLAFARLAQTTAFYGPAVSLALITELARAVGSGGMVGGQCLDIETQGQCLSVDEQAHIHALKTGALLQVSVVLGALVAGVDTQTVEKLRLFGQVLGLAFQLQDDLQDEQQDRRAHSQLSESRAAGVADGGLARLEALCLAGREALLAFEQAVSGTSVDIAPMLALFRFSVGEPQSSTLP